MATTIKLTHFNKHARPAGHNSIMLLFYQKELLHSVEAQRSADLMVRNKDILSSHIQDFYRIEDIASVENALSHATAIVRRSRPGPEWHFFPQQEKLHCGSFRSKHEFDMLCLHELGHIFKKSFGITYDTASAEESACWDFSKGACGALSIPFDPQLVSLQLRFSELLITASPPAEFERRFDSLVDEEIRLRGFSDWSRRGF